ncbi:hypothetical protein GCM10012275_56050 [Longimycelium tulufanense]|uniref:Phosphomevalonate kinase n=1 Tax=Longimycelium tulufanense TaxID=907463 RepID=A0A8J3CJR3_9PSEU|nr:hypothetical protein [Longimycelium tulufanense]GGM78190.1 hypothetical protein GCM10012275_56050 [Longimycelium tulufanense]
MLPHIALVGSARSGKDTVAQHLLTRYGYVRVALADPVRDALLIINPLVATTTGEVGRLAELVAAHGWEEVKTLVPEARRLMQVLGTDVVRALIDPDAWVRIAIRTAEKHHAAGQPVVVSDVRYPNEADAFRTHGYLLVRITRPGHRSDDAHSSETTHHTIDCDVELTNTTVTALTAQVDQLIAQHEHA